jgi:hypothetical protein
MKPLHLTYLTDIFRIGSSILTLSTVSGAPNLHHLRLRRGHSCKPIYTYYSFHYLIRTKFVSSAGFGDDFKSDPSCERHIAARMLPIAYEVLLMASTPAYLL